MNATNFTVPYEQAPVVSGMHKLPRFGHSNSISNLVSYDRGEQEDYVRGMLSFCAFVGVFFLSWALILLLLKLAPPDHVGCAAGGAPIDVVQLRKDKVRRLARRQRILRAWRLQWVFVVASLCIPIVTLVFLRKGLNPFLDSLGVVQEINDDVETIAYRGMSIATSLVDTRKSLEGNITDATDLSKHCPNAQNSQMLQTMGLQTMGWVIEVGLNDLDAVLDENLSDSHDAMDGIVKLTQTIDATIDVSNSNDWTIKFYLMVLNVINGFFFFGIILTRNDIDFFPFQRLLTFILGPVLFLMLVLAVLATCTLAFGLMINADFCSGGPYPGSPEGTIQDVIFQRGTQESLTFQMFIYYMKGCTDDNPIQFLAELEPLIEHTIHAVELTQLNLQNYSLDELKKECGGDLDSFTNNLPPLIDILEVVLANVKGAWELTGCHNINPILLRVLHGATCFDSVRSLTWLFGSSLGICFLGLLMFSVRAALYNPIIRAPKRVKKNDREKEFGQYKDFMAKYYNDVDDWKLNPEEGSGLPRGETFETSETTQEHNATQSNCSSDLSSLDSDDDEEEDRTASSSILLLFNSLRKGPQLEDELLSQEVSNESSTNNVHRSLLGRRFPRRSEDIEEFKKEEDITETSGGDSLLGEVLSVRNDGENQIEQHDNMSPLNDDSFVTPRQRRKRFSKFPSKSASKAVSPCDSVNENEEQSSPLSTGKLPPDTPRKLMKFYGRTKGAKKLS